MLQIDFAAPCPVTVPMLGSGLYLVLAFLAGLMLGRSRAKS